MFLYYLFRPDGNACSHGGPGEAAQIFVSDYKGQKILWRRKWQCTPVFSPEQCHGQSSLAVYSSSWGLKKLDTTEH